VNESTPLVVKQTGPIRTLTLNRPRRRNALNAPLVDALDSALTDAASLR
jgi:enoyl-CoA hydratase